MEWQKLTVICLVIGVIECAVMGVGEIEEFRNFLKKTSHLEETLKKGPGVDHDDVGDAVSDHAWEDSGKFEGDIILNERQRKVIVQEVAEGLSRNGLLDTTKRWPDNEVIYYIQREHFTSDQVQAIEDGMGDLAQASCIKFRPYKKGDRDAVVIQGSRRGCFSQVGYQGGYQVLNLSGRHPVGRGCFRHGTVVHELLHTLGFYHMQSSPDRDDYISVLWENIIEPAKHNFRKYNTFSVSDFGVGYDYDSVLHYSRRAFSRNGRDTLVPKQNGASIGQRAGLSDKDTQKLNKMYCDAGSDDSALKDEQVEQRTEKSVSKKQKAPEPKHFEGHGLAYHQGKTVVIKLTPSAAKTYKLPDYPTFDMFDYFSKTPETLSPTYDEDTGIGKQLDYTYEPPRDFISSGPEQEKEDHSHEPPQDFITSGPEKEKEDHSHEPLEDFISSGPEQEKEDHSHEPPLDFTFSGSEQEKEDHSHELDDSAENDNSTFFNNGEEHIPNIFDDITEKQPLTEDFFNKSNINNDNDNSYYLSDHIQKKSTPEKDKPTPEKDSSNKQSSENEEKKISEKQSRDENKDDKRSNVTSENIEFDYNDAFERLGQIIKAHVYPSQNPNFDIYKGIGYQFDDEKNSAPKTEKLDKDQKNNISSSQLIDSKYLNVLNDKYPREFAHLYDAAAKISKEQEQVNNSQTKDKVTNSSEPTKNNATATRDEDAYEYSYPFRDEYDSNTYKFDPEHLPYKDYSTLSYPEEKKIGNILNEELPVIGYAVSADSFDDKHSHEQDDEYPYDIYTTPDFKYTSGTIKHDKPEYRYLKIDKPPIKSKQAFKIIGLIVPISGDLHKEKSKRT